MCAMLSVGICLAAEPAAPATPDTLHLKNGTVLPCRIGELGVDGKVRFRTPLFDGQVSALPEHVKRLNVAAAASEDASPLALLLTNGDRVAGDLVELTDDVIVVDSPTVGRAEIPRSLVRCIIATSGGVGAVWSDFISGALAPWRTKTGVAVVRGGALQSPESAKRRACVVSVPLKQKGATTIQAVVRKGRASYPGVTLWLHGSGWQGSRYQNGIYANFSLGNCTLYRVLGGRSQNLGRSVRVNLDRNTPKATYTLAYDAESRAIKVWVNAQLVGTFLSDIALPAGEEVGVMVMYRTLIRSVTVRPGVHAPVEDGGLPDDKGRVVFKNGDSWLITRGVAVRRGADGLGRLVLDTPDGEVGCLFGLVARIDLPAGESATPRRNPGDARVNIGRTLLTLQVGQMTETTLRGRSDYLGELRLPRKLLRSIEFDIYR
jgi:hypothetical protein